MERVVYYSEFGAVGDGVHEDFPAIVKCHEYANENGYKVMADPGATYYIGNTGGVSAIVKTDVDWGDATFIIDDRIITPDNPSRTANIFRILRDHPMRYLGEDSEEVRAINARGGISADEMDNIGYKPGYPVLLAIFDNEHSAYVRWGNHATGKPNPQREIVVVDAEGAVQPDTKLLLDYSHVSYIQEYRIDDKPIVIENGTFITRANCAPPVYTAYNRALGVERSNVTIRGTVHKITDEGPIGAPYSGFIFWYAINNLRCENLTLQAHKSYKDYGYDENGKVVRIHSIMGSYDIGGSFATNVTFKDCVQSNYYKYKEKNIVFSYEEYWGIMGTNYCKNLIYDSCVLSRLDAHAGVYNVIIKDTTITYISLTGGGTALIEGSTIIAPESRGNPALYGLREDYGSTWRGDIIIKDCTFINWYANEVVLQWGQWHNWDFGYKTYLPRVIIDNLTLDKPTEKVYVFCPYAKDASIGIDKEVLTDGTKNLNPMNVSTEVIIRNNKAGYNYVSTSDPYVASKIRLINE